MIPQLPRLDDRSRKAVLEELLRRLPGYTPEWSPEDRTAASALLQVFARYMEILIDGLNQVPEHRRLVFLEMMGRHLLPAQAARAPLVFQLADGTPTDVTLPAGSQVAAPAQPAAPSPLGAATAAEPQPAIFATAQTITLSRGRLATLYSLDPSRDEYAEHTPDLAQSFTLFGDMRLTEHEIYLGHDTLFALAGDITVLLYFSLESSSHRGLNIAWEYLTEQGWLPFEAPEHEDTSQGLQKDGQIVLRRECGPNAKQETIDGRTSFWIRGRLAAPFPPENSRQPSLPVVNDIRARVGINKTGLLPDAAFVDAVPVDVSKDFYPFGEQPVTFTTFYLASREVFQRKGAQVRLDVKLSQQGRTHGPLQLTWEYCDGTTWNPLGVNSGEYDFTTDSSVSFLCPSNWAETKVNGVNNYWLRVRITRGTYGYPMRLNSGPERTIDEVSNDLLTLKLDTNEGYNGGESVTLSKGGTSLMRSIAYRLDGNWVVLASPIPVGSDLKGGKVAAVPGPDQTPLLLSANLQPPRVSKLSLGYTYLTDPETPDHCLARNDFVFADHSEASRWPDQTFSPFRPLSDRQPTIHFGFDQKLPAGLVGLYVDAAQESKAVAPVAASPFVWDYHSARGWVELGVLDETQGFQRGGMIQFVGPPDLAAVGGLGGELYRIRARLKQGERLPEFSPTRLWLNAVWAEQRTSFVREPMGSSDGNPGQVMFFPRRPVLEGERIEVQEWTGRGEGWKRVVEGIPEADRRFERDPATDDVQAVWIAWQSRPHLYDSGPAGRHYEIDRALGLVRFGDGQKGRIPPAGRRIVATYSSGGGLSGNVPAGAITELRTAVPFLQSASNPVAASGGAEMEARAAVLRRGPQALRNRERAVSAEDFEWLARQASPAVARARCLALVGPAGHAQRGWVTLVVVPHSMDRQPHPTPELRRRVVEYLVKRMPASASAQVRMVTPTYAPVSVRAEIVLRDPQEAAQVEARLRQNLTRFLHPLYGGPDSLGWEFGQPVYLSQVAGVIESTTGVDFTRFITLMVAGTVFGDAVEVDPCALVASGDHEIKLTLGGR